MQRTIMIEWWLAFYSPHMYLIWKQWDKPIRNRADGLPGSGQAVENIRPWTTPTLCDFVRPHYRENCFHITDKTTFLPTKVPKTWGKLALLIFDDTDKKEAVYIRNRAGFLRLRIIRA